jgi:hypothetical protein
VRLRGSFAASANAFAVSGLGPVGVQDPDWIQVDIQVMPQVLFAFEPILGASMAP